MIMMILVFYQYCFLQQLTVYYYITVHLQGKMKRESVGKIINTLISGTLIAY